MKPDQYYLCTVWGWNAADQVGNHKTTRLETPCRANEWVAEMKAYYLARGFEVERENFLDIDGARLTMIRVDAGIKQERRVGWWKVDQTELPLPFAT